MTRTNRPTHPRSYLDAEGGTRDGRKPLLPHLIDDHGLHPNAVYDQTIMANLEMHRTLHDGGDAE